MVYFERIESEFHNHYIGPIFEKWKFGQFRIHCIYTPFWRKLKTLDRADFQQIELWLISFSLHRVYYEKFKFEEFQNYTMWSKSFENLNLTI